MRILLGTDPAYPSLVDHTHHPTFNAALNHQATAAAAAAAVVSAEQQLDKNAFPEPPPSPCSSASSGLGDFRDDVGAAPRKEQEWKSYLGDRAGASKADSDESPTSTADDATNVDDMDELMMPLPSGLPPLTPTLQGPDEAAVPTGATGGLGKCPRPPGVAHGGGNTYGGGHGQGVRHYGGHHAEHVGVHNNGGHADVDDDTEGFAIGCEQLGDAGTPSSSENHDDDGHFPHPRKKIRRHSGQSHDMRTAADVIPAVRVPPEVEVTSTRLVTAIHIPEVERNFPCRPVQVGVVHGSDGLSYIQTLFSLDDIAALGSKRTDPHHHVPEQPHLADPFPEKTTDTTTTNPPPDDAKPAPAAQVKVRKYANPTASRFCHICARSSRGIPMAVCQNVRHGVCRKVICEKCCVQHGWTFVPPTPEMQSGAVPSGFVCAHCKGQCPDRAQCNTYRRTNQRRRMKGAEKRRMIEEAMANGDDVGAILKDAPAPGELQ